MTDSSLLTARFLSPKRVVDIRLFPKSAFPLLPRRLLKLSTASAFIIPLPLMQVATIQLPILSTMGVESRELMS